MPNGSLVDTERQPEECKIRHMNGEPEGCVVVNNKWSLNRHNNIVQIGMIMVMLRKINSCNRNLSTQTIDAGDIASGK